jgi:carboxypeptidase C (cathepsin A)
MFNVTATKSLHYVFLESTNDPANDPVLLWSNGGPGCSSLLGLFAENGPYILDNNNQVCVENPYPWNKNASLLYIESPAGVGFSRAGAEADWAQNDMTQSEDLFKAVEMFFAAYPERLPNEFYLSGESYAGIYLPYLAWQIYQSNLQYNISNMGNETTPVGTFYNLKGMAVGNGATDWDFDNAPSVPQTMWGFNMINTANYTAYNSNGCVDYFNGVRPSIGSAACPNIT